MPEWSCIETMISTTHSTPGICFYIHHHGAGHLMRAVTIANVLQDMQVYFIGSNLASYQHLIPIAVTCIPLPPDLPDANEAALPDSTPSFLHYAPLGISGQRARTALITEIFNTNYPLLLVVDVSVEITLLARLCGVPTIVIRQHGERNDVAHLQAYESAELLIAPYSKIMAAQALEQWVDQKTLFAGGFSKYSSRQDDNNTKELRHNIAILIGEGGTSINNDFIEYLAKACSMFTFHVIGAIAVSQATQFRNIIFHGKLEDPETILSACAAVIGNGGHNTVMEMATLNKRFICIPEDRPFDEQQQKAQILARNGNAKIIQNHEVKQVDWENVLQTILNQTPNWNGVIAKDALSTIRTAIYDTVERLFGTQKT